MSVFAVILVRNFPHSDQNNSEYGHFYNKKKLIIECKMGEEIIRLGDIETKKKIHRCKNLIF